MVPPVMGIFITLLLSLLLTLATARAQPPTTVPSPSEPHGQIAVGLGAYLYDAGVVEGKLLQVSVGLRVTKRVWITAAYGHPWETELEYNDYSELYLSEGSLAVGYTICQGTGGCLALSGGAGYQNAGYTYVALIPGGGIQEEVKSLDRVFLEARGALRWVSGHAWLEGAFAVREHFKLGDGRGEERELGFVVGAAVYLSF